MEDLVRFCEVLVVLAAFVFVLLQIYKEYKKKK